MANELLPPVGIGGNSSVRPITILQLGGGGHRLAYVDAVAQHAFDRGGSVTVLVTSEAASGQEFAVHLRHHVVEGRVRLEIDDTLTTRRGMASALRRVRESGACLVMLECDRSLVDLLKAKIRGNLPRSASLNVMRPPRRASAGTRASVVPIVKWMLLCTLLCFRKSVDLMFLDDPLASGDDRVWNHWPMDSPRRRLDDPYDLIPDGPIEIIPEIGMASGPIFSVIGAIDVRKRVPLVLEAWANCEASNSGTLVVAGRWSPGAALELHDRSFGPSVKVLPRYLSNGELLGLLDASIAVFVLHDQGLSSGVLTAAAARGVNVIALQDSRTGRSASSAGVGHLCLPDPGSLSRAIDSVARENRRPSPVALPGRNDFAARVLRMAMSP